LLLLLLPCDGNANGETKNATDGGERRDGRGVVAVKSRRDKTGNTPREIANRR